MLNVLSPGPMTTVQDLGRFGYERFGVPRSGAVDWFALRAANRLVGNHPDAAGLEFVLDAPLLQAGEDCLVAAAGQGFSLSIQGRQVGLWRAAFVRMGELIHFTAEEPPGWGFLAVAGGIDIPLVMGSRSTYLRGGFGGYKGRVLQAGDSLPIGKPAENWIALSGSGLPPEKRLVYASQTVPVILGPQNDFFSIDSLSTFLSSEYQVSANSDRMGYRLTGATVKHRGRVELVSEGIAPGSVQVPPDGQPIVMLSDRPTTGGYPKIATVILAGLPQVAQAMPGSGRVRFSLTSQEEARVAHRNLLEWIEDGVQNDDD